MTYCLRVCTVKYLPSFVCLLALECCCSFHLLATYISSFWPAWCAFTFFFWLFHFLFPVTSWMFLFRLNAVIGSFLKISLRILITCKIFQFFLTVSVVFVWNQLHVITRSILFDFFVWLYVCMYVYIYIYICSRTVERVVYSAITCRATMNWKFSSCSIYWTPYIITKL